jgi:hypothetical protein
LTLLNIFLPITDHSEFACGALKAHLQHQ